ncbi:unnamed protein product [Arabidopsis thaliana]|uniref:(thale cress) hypothetical protein n=1 Tax=Arabidopsis thaliana TaxID=3702 RepID=A0A7G2E2B5_ARATH|nr:unnamed protein product [Arabidopsis thaliana]
MAGREVKEYTNLSDPKDKKSGKGKIDDEDVTFQRMVAKMQEVAGERGGYLHGRGDSDDLLYLKEQMEAEEDAEPATQADSSPASIPLPLRVEPKPKSGIRQQDLLRKVVEVKPKRPKISTPSSPSLSPPVRSDRGPTEAKVHRDKQKEEAMPVLKKPGADRNDGKATESNGQGQNAPKGLLGLAYDSSDEED